MSATIPELSYDPYDVDINADPYPVFRRLRDEAPVYYNPEHDFYALSRHADVEAGLKDNARLISGRGGILELIKANLEMPPGTVIFEDPPTHTIHRKLMSRMFTPRKTAALEERIRAYCAAALDPLVGRSDFDLIADFASEFPMRVIGMLLGIPEVDQVAIRDRADANLRTEAGKPMTASTNFTNEKFVEYFDWRADHPSDDIMTELMNAEFTDEHGERRTLTREELLVYISVVSGAGNETTNRLIGWAGKVLAEHPDQRAELVADPSLIPNAIEEILRFESPAPHVGRYVAEDVEFQGSTISAGSAVLLLVGSANRDERKFPDPDRFDIHRSTKGLLSFGFGAHFCLGAALARIEGRIALEEFLRRFPEWSCDLDAARISPTSTVRGWETLPVSIP